MKITDASNHAALARLYDGGWCAPAETVDAVAAIIAEVRTRGDAALVDYTRRFDSKDFKIDSLRVRVPMMEQARNLIPDEVVQGLQLAKSRIAAFHERQRPADIDYVEEDASAYGFHYVPLDAIAAYVPGGTATLPSSVLMSVIPAKIAGVGRIVVLTPPQGDGGVNGAILFACALCGVDELYAVGGAQAIAAAAYGTASIDAVDKIVGPGNVYVTEAKRQVFGACGIDGLAGPSEVLVVADGKARVEFVAGELLAQAEHDPLARVGVVSENRGFLESVARLLDTMHIASLERAAIVESVLKDNAYLIHARSRSELFEVISRFAPEHLSLQVEDPHAYLPAVRHAGAIFVGAQTPVAAGDYLAGSNHVLPTSGAARFSSGLRVADFMRTFSIVQYSERRMQEDARALSVLADYEGLPQHAHTARMRIP